jgi:hypothetical protein
MRMTPARMKLIKALAAATKARAKAFGVGSGISGEAWRAALAAHAKADADLKKGGIDYMWSRKHLAKLIHCL